MKVDDIRSIERCKMCGVTPQATCITAFGDRAPSWIVGACLCPPPPVACCPFCETRLDASGRCEHIDCFFISQVAPEPTMLVNPIRPAPADPTRTEWR